MRPVILALALLATGCNDLPPSPENIAATYKDAALKALKKEAPGDIQMKDFRMYVYLPESTYYPDRPERITHIYMCGSIAGRDATGWRSSDEPVIIWGNVMYDDKKIIGEAEIAEVYLVERIKDRFERRSAERMLDNECEGKEFDIQNSETGITISYIPHAIPM